MVGEKSEGEARITLGRFAVSKELRQAQFASASGYVDGVLPGLICSTQRECYGRQLDRIGAR